MKPNFALSLSFDGIRLLHRAAGGWHFVGEVSVSDPNLSNALANLLQAGHAVKTRKNLRCKLIIPDEQIKYLSIDTPGMDADARRAKAAEALDGATPYPVDALAYDISPDGPRTHVAAVARETLLEAEAFAKEHGFEPVSFVAAAEVSDFLGEPFFGPTAHSTTLLRNGNQVKPDGVRVVIVEQPKDDVSAAETTPPEEPAKIEDPIPEVAPITDVSESAVEPQLALQTEAEVMPEPEPEPEISAAPLVSGKKETTPPAIAAEPDAQPEPNPVATELDAPAVAAVTPKVEAETASTLAASATAPQTDVSTPPLLGFATRRRQDPSSTPAPARLGGVSRDAPIVRPTPPVSEQVASPSQKPPTINLTTPPKSVADSLRPTPMPAPRAAPVVARATPEPAEVAEVAPIVAAAVAKPRTGGFLSRRKPVTDQAAAALAKPTRQNARDAKRGARGDAETSRMTVFGARDGDIVGGKPRFLGLILMAILLVFLAGVAAWATVFMDDSLSRLFQGRDRTLASTLPDDARDTLAQDVGATTEIEADREGAEDGVVVAALNDNLSDHGLSAEDAAVLDALRDPLPDPVAPEELDAAEVEARYAVTGIWPVAPDLPPAPAGLIDIEDLYVTGIDPVSPALDAVALPTLSSLQTDSQPALVTSPVAAGTNFARSADGLVIPTLEGALSPDGFTVFLGSPPIVPPTTLARLEAVPDLGPDVSAVAQVRPQPRPADLVEQNERATLGGLSRQELAALRPRLRPKAPQEIAQDAQQEEETQAAQAAPETVEPEAIDEAVVAALTIAPTLRPETRPRNFNRIVARTRRNAPSAAPAAAATTSTRTASVAPRTVTPAVPSAASVARNATIQNAINLRQVNLIGVYGTPSNRRALVRLSNGRYQKVGVGDRFDGGRVSAIGDSELRYQKGNRNLILTIPQG